ncbi:MAG: hypothetical protein Q7S58_11095 [Candidatus Binatus sp.]|uniref:zf-HC2 domain-containing protein n=1 Tax=Candidatus Binatus sp. TaxID=2811406 RepID=UPI002728E271|nr:hypothetical protein [Candidatus Binatus sp.]MDO8432942.1 hypothetical protein [Candidatus Binatus sp.]
MNCFETRNEFPALWRKTASAERRAELLAHLAGCAKCDRAFRAFALTAPVLHSDSEPPAASARSPGDRRDFSAFDRPLRFASIPRVEQGPRRWLAMSAAAAIFVFASGAAYLSARSSSDTLNDLLSKPEISATSEAAADPFAPELPSIESDLAS